MTITAAQCRSARTLLSWSVSRLANAASINRCEIDDFELERRVPHTETQDTIRHALEVAGIVFLSHDDVRMHRGRARSSDCRGDDGELRVPPYLDQQADEFDGFPRQLDG
jgi:transcriptional regulator with XRE-family HTH domain